jgi:phenylacetic acid degradation operon negative regulatory protein
VNRVAVENESEQGERGAQPGALLITLYGLYAREVGGWLPVAALVSLLGELGVDEPAVRSSLSRLKRRGVLLASRSSDVAGYMLSDEATISFGRGDRWIFDRPRTRLSDGWLLIAFTVPQEERAKRYKLRSTLALRGFGIVAPGLWVAPANLYEVVVPLLENLDLIRYVTFFRADHWGTSSLVQLVKSWWDLDAIGEMYRGFIEHHEELRNDWRAPIRVDEGHAFADYARLVDEWRRLPYLDPGLPAELLPEDWPGVWARELFSTIRAQLEEPARLHVRRTLDAVMRRTVDP